MQWSKRMVGEDEIFTAEGQGIRVTLTKVRRTLTWHAEVRVQGATVATSALPIGPHDEWQAKDQSVELARKYVMSMLQSLG